MIELPRIVVDICKAYLHNQEYILPNNIDKVALFTMAKEQQCGSLLYSTISNKEDLGESKALFENYLWNNVKLSMLQDQARAQLAGFMESHNYPYAFLKGSIIKNLYKDSAMRVMSDIDILISPDDLNNVKTYLTSNGYVFSDNYKQVFGYTKGAILIELHADILYDHGNDLRQLLTYKDILNGKEISIENQYAYVILHLAKHINSAGSGIRNFVDIALLRDNSVIDYKIVDKILSEYDKSDFENIVLALINTWFDRAYPTKATIDKDFSDIMINYVLEAGVYGLDHRSYGAVKISQTSSRFKALMITLFPSYKLMKINYPILKKCCLLAPICYIHRIIDRAKQKNKSKSFLKGIVANSDESNTLKQIKKNLRL